MIVGEIEKFTILAGLKPMFKEARTKGLWFFCRYQSLWFSPDELEAAHKEGRFVWGKVNWMLRDPLERVAQLNKEIRNAEAEKEQFLKRLN